MLPRRGYIILFILLLSIHSFGQQFIGLTVKDYTAIQFVPSNPAWVTSAAKGAEVNLFGINVTAGTNAYLLKRDWLFGGSYSGAQKDVDYYKNLNEYKKHIWGNIDVLGPAFSFNYKEKHNIGVYTRFREIVRAGNITNTEFKLFGYMDAAYYNVPLNFNKSGVSTHTFAEIGFSYGRELRNDYYHILNAGVTVKYLMGFAAGSVYTPNTSYVQSDKDSIAVLKGDITGVFSYNANPVDGIDNKFDPEALLHRAGRGSLGLDIGFRYEYHENGDPNVETPYSYSIAASITDIGGITYIADTGSGNYTFTVDKEIIEAFSVKQGEQWGQYIGRLIADSLLIRNKNIKKFRVGLPTAFRLNADYNATKNLNFSVNLLLNLRGNGGDIYKPAYVNYINMTPTYGKKFKVGMPLTFIGYQTVTLGTIFQTGPLYLGSNTLLSSALSSNFKNLDFYMGLTLKFRKEQRNYYF
jgi:hypothetical protein